jgi:ATP-dependent RNA helicase SUPV3L1/SUV3
LVENDLALLRDILPSPLTPVPRAVVEPGHERLAELSLLLPDEIPYGRLLEIYESLVHMSPACMPAAVLPHIKLSELLRAFTKDLTLKEMATFGFAPVNVRDNKVVATFQNYVQAYVKEGEVDILEALESSRLIPNLELVELTRSTMKDPGSEQRPGTIPPPIPAAIVIAIPGLESLHKALVLYIWLSFRLELNFPDRAEATALKLRTEAMLDFCLERLPGLKRKKLPKTSHKTKAERLAEQEALQQLPLNTTRKIDWIPREKINALRQQSQYSNLDVLPDTRL